MKNTVQVYITDKTGKRFWNTLCSKMYSDAEIRNQQRRLQAARLDPESFKFIDVETAKIIIEDKE